MAKNKHFYAPKIIIIMTHKKIWPLMGQSGLIIQPNNTPNINHYKIYVHFNPILNLKTKLIK